MLYMKYEYQTSTGEEKKILSVFRIIKLRKITIHMKILILNMRWHI